MNPGTIQNSKNRLLLTDTLLIISIATLLPELVLEQKYEGQPSILLIINIGTSTPSSAWSFFSQKLHFLENSGEFLKFLLHP